MRETDAAQGKRAEVCNVHKSFQAVMGDYNFSGAGCFEVLRAGRLAPLGVSLRSSPALLGGGVPLVRRTFDVVSAWLVPLSIRGAVARFRRRECSAFVGQVD